MFDNINKILEEEGEKALSLFKQKLRQLDPYANIATGELEGSTKYKVQITDSFVRLLFEYPNKYFDISTGELFLEQGRQPGKYTPIEPIKKWVIIRQIQPKGEIDKFGKYKSRWRGAEGNDNLVSPYAIQRGIYLYGIEPKYYIRQIKEQLINEGIETRVNEAIRKDITDILKKYDII